MFSRLSGDGRKSGVDGVGYRVDASDESLRGMTISEKLSKRELTDGDEEQKEGMRGFVLGRGANGRRCGR